MEVCFLCLRKIFSRFVTIVTLRPLSINTNTDKENCRLRGTQFDPPAVQLIQISIILGRTNFDSPLGPILGLCE